MDYVDELNLGDVASGIKIISDEVQNKAVSSSSSESLSVAEISQSLVRTMERIASELFNDQMVCQFLSLFIEFMGLLKLLSAQVSDSIRIYGIDNKFLIETPILLWKKLIQLYKKYPSIRFGEILASKIVIVFVERAQVVLDALQEICVRAGFRSKEVQDSLKLLDYFIVRIAATLKYHFDELSTESLARALSTLIAYRGTIELLCSQAEGSYEDVRLQVVETCSKAISFNPPLGDNANGGSNPFGRYFDFLQQLMSAWSIALQNIYITNASSFSFLQLNQQAHFFFGSACMLIDNLCSTIEIYLKYLRSNPLDLLTETTGAFEEVFAGCLDLILQSFYFVCLFASPESGVEDRQVLLYLAKLPSSIHLAVSNCKPTQSGLESTFALLISKTKGAVHRVIVSYCLDDSIPNAVTTISHALFTIWMQSLSPVEQSEMVRVLIVFLKGSINSEQVDNGHSYMLHLGQSSSRRFGLMLRRWMVGCLVDPGSEDALVLFITQFAEIIQQLSGGFSQLNLNSAPILSSTSAAPSQDLSVAWIVEILQLIPFASLRASSSSRFNEVIRRLEAACFQSKLSIFEGLVGSFIGVTNYDGTHIPPRISDKKTKCFSCSLDPAKLCIFLSGSIAQLIGTKSPAPGSIPSSGPLFKLLSDLSRYITSGYHRALLPAISILSDCTIRADQSSSLPVLQVLSTFGVVNEEFFRLASVARSIFSLDSLVSEIVQHELVNMELTTAATIRSIIGSVVKSSSALGKILSVLVPCVETLHLVRRGAENESELKLSRSSKRDLASIDDCYPAFSVQKRIRSEHNQGQQRSLGTSSFDSIGFGQMDFVPSSPSAEFATTFTLMNQFLSVISVCTSLLCRRLRVVCKVEICAHLDMPCFEILTEGIRNLSEVAFTLARLELSVVSEQRRNLSVSHSACLQDYSVTSNQDIIFRKTVAAIIGEMYDLATSVAAALPAGLKSKIPTMVCLEMLKFVQASISLKESVGAISLLPITLSPNRYAEVARILADFDDSSKC